MLTENQLARVCVVLVRARNPQNIGAVARAMHDFGFRHLRVVNEFTIPFEAARSAIDASAVLEDAFACRSVADAVADCTLVVGTTAIGERALEHPVVAAAQAAPLLHAELNRKDAGRVALLFGSEKTGLSNEELSHCHWLLHIPMHAHAGLRHPSMNLGQAVAVCLYELVRERTPQAALSHPAASRGTAASAEAENAEAKSAEADRPEAENLERLTRLLQEVLTTSGYTRHHPARSDLADLRRLVLRMNSDRTDAAVWMGILRQVLWKLRSAGPGPR